jgi:hypothetical protein
MKNEFNMKKSVTFAVQKNRRNMLEKNRVNKSNINKKKNQRISGQDTRRKTCFLLGNKVCNFQLQTKRK